MFHLFLIHVQRLDATNMRKEEQCKNKKNNCEGKNNWKRGSYDGRNNLFPSNVSDGVRVNYGNRNVNEVRNNTQYRQGDILQPRAVENRKPGSQIYK